MIRNTDAHFMLQVIQTVSAMDKDDPKNGHYFLYSLLPEMVNNPNFTIKKNEGKYVYFEKCCRVGTGKWQVISQMQMGIIVEIILSLVAEAILSAT